jgi:glycosyl-4,4'-diaponeurosporenoate acyltransferase
VLIDLPMWGIVALNAGGWLTVQVGLAILFTRLPGEWFEGGRVFSAEEGFYERVCFVRLWKDYLPDGAKWVGGAVTIGTLRLKRNDHWRLFLQETRRGELCHWVAMGFAPVFFLWNPLWGDFVIVAYAIAANLPCVLAQRFNRGRIVRLRRNSTINKW